jgi:hypothetical protein
MKVSDPIISRSSVGYCHPMLLINRSWFPTNLTSLILTNQVSSVMLRPKKLEIRNKSVYNCNMCKRKKGDPKHSVMKLSQIRRKIELCMRDKGLSPLQRGDNHKNVKMGWGSFKIFFSRTTGPIFIQPWHKLSFGGRGFKCL